MYEAGKTLLRYEEELTVANQQPECLRLPRGPLGDSEGSESNSSQETGDSGHYSHAEGNETDAAAAPQSGWRGEKERRGSLSEEICCSVPLDSTEEEASCSPTVCQ